MYISMCVCARVKLIQSSTQIDISALYTETHDNLENLWKPMWKPLQNKRKPENLLIIKI
jgi:hypothetical protein